jgi:hypothetical protein
MSGMIDGAPCPICDNRDASYINDDGPVVVICDRCGYRGDPGEFDPSDYDWIDPKDLCPEEGGLVLIETPVASSDPGDCEYGLAVYLATEEGDRWIGMNPDGSAGPDIDPPTLWAELPEGCYNFPRPYTPKYAVYQWGGVWAWVISSNLTSTPEDEVCWPFSTRAEAQADLRVKLKEIC